MAKNFYITTTLPYVNAEPHLGFALEIIQTDAIARYHRILGEKVIFNFGTDEHGQKIYQKALEEKKDPQAYCDEYAAKFNNLKSALNLSYTNFIRTTDRKHLEAVSEIWQRCFKNGDIYKKNYKQKYCVGCELEKTDSELINNRCPFHPNREIEIIEEENYFFRFSKYQDKLLEFYEKNPDFVIPAAKYREIKAFVKAGLEDFSISRLKKKMPWGVPVPKDPDHVIFVWFDALTNYISTLGWPKDQKNFANFWPGIQVAGKDNLRQQTAIWQAMLLSAKIPNSKQVFIHGFITVNGQKISKSLGNAIDPFDLVKKYGTDPVRYFLLAKLNPYEDSDFTLQRFETDFNADLANGLGNLVSRVATLCAKSEFNFPSEKRIQFDPKIGQLLDVFRFDEALKLLWEKVSLADGFINKHKPWELKGKGLQKILVKAVFSLREIGINLTPFLPETAEKIQKQFEGPKIKPEGPLFPRL